jgi:hypothetical protein
MPLWLHHIIALFRGTHASMLRDLEDVKNRLAAHSNYKSQVAIGADKRAAKLLTISAESEAHADQLFLQAVKVGEIINPPKSDDN